MTSTNVHIGLIDDARKSSRVLKPPGGGHSDIFGVHEEQPISRVHRQNSSSLNGLFGNDEPVCKNNGKFSDNIIPINEADLQETVKKTVETAEVMEEEIKSPVEIPTPAAASVPEPAQQPQQRKRVPPGGYSSGLW